MVLALSSSLPLSSLLCSDQLKDRSVALLYLHSFNEVAVVSCEAKACSDFFIILRDWPILDSFCLFQICKNSFF